MTSALQKQSQGNPCFYLLFCETSKNVVQVFELMSPISENCCRNSQHPHQIYHLVIKIQVGQTFQHTMVYVVLGLQKQ